MLIKLFMLMLAVSGVWSGVLPENQVATAARTTTGDLDTAATSAKLLNLFGSGYPNYGYNYNRPSNGYYPSYPSYYGSSNYYPNTGYYGSSNVYSSQGYVPNNYYSGGGSYYPTTNILGTQGYGGYGGYGGGYVRTTYG